MPPAAQPAFSLVCALQADATLATLVNYRPIYGYTPQIKAMKRNDEME
jgi:hypothetical protein